MEYFVAGSISKMDDQLWVMVTLHETSTTKSLAEKTFKGNEILEMVDQIRVWMKETISLPLQHLDSTVDLPISEILTKSPRALKIFYQGMNECYIRQNWEKGLALLGQSVQQDSTFAYAYSQVIDAN